MAKRLAGVALATAIAACLLASGAERARAATINFSEIGSYDGDNYDGAGFSYDTSTGEGTAYAAFGYPFTNYQLQEYSDEVTSAYIYDNSIDFRNPQVGQYFGIDIHFNAHVTGYIPLPNGTLYGSNGDGAGVDKHQDL